jgi:hypothetical protein
MRYAISAFTLATVLATGAAFAQTSATTQAPKSGVTIAAPATTSTTTTTTKTKKTRKHRHHAKKAAATTPATTNAPAGNAQAPAASKK